MRKMMLWIAGLFCLSLLPASLLAQERTISGKITDANGAPLPSISVVIKQTNKGTTTDAEGKFQLIVPANATLLITSAGYKMQTIQVGTSAEINVKMEEDIARLDEVVVTGFGTRTNTKKLAYAIQLGFGQLCTDCKNGTCDPVVKQFELCGQCRGVNSEGAI